MASQPSSPPPAPKVVEKSKKDFSFLLKPELYPPLKNSDVPSAFHDDYDVQGHSQDDIPPLLADGRFRRAANLAAYLLNPSRTSSSDHQTIFKLVYVRLACLQLLGLHQQAGQESRVLQDLNHPFYHDGTPASDAGPADVNVAHLAPWALRVLTIRLQALGFNDWRRAIMAYYELANEARSQIRRLSRASPGDENVRVWRARLHDLGVLVGNGLVEMNDLDGAKRHFASLPPPPPSSETSTPSHAEITALRLGLISLKAGDIPSTTSNSTSTSTWTSTLLKGLTQISNSAFADATTTFSFPSLTSDTQAQTHAVAPIAAQNKAIAHLYAGQIAQRRREKARQILEAQTREADAEGGADLSPPATFNLATLYELCGERAGEWKRELAAEAAKAGVSEGRGVDFKL